MGRPEYELLSRLRTEGADGAKTKIRVTEEDAATGETAAAYQYFRDQTGRQDVPGILKCFATNPTFARQMVDISSSLLFCDGALTRRQKELIATYISHLNACPYCFDSHGFFLVVHGASRQIVDDLAAGNLAQLSGAERALLLYLGKVERESFKATTEDVQHLRDLGWREEQIAEAVLVATMLGFCNRVANAFGLPPQNLLALQFTSL
ncbi:MAG TPA: peroxidase-related enzyme [Candidatus Angelobacter sp.]|nr:peroxidase-related enzyme [Candidatus Angelobacter sp.]